MKPPITLTIDEQLYQQLRAHLFPGDGDEHGAALSVGVAESDRGTRLLARDLYLARDGVDYVPGTRAYRALTARFVAETTDRCASQGLGYLSIHCHGGRDRVEFSPDDIASHERGYPAILDITKGGPAGALVFAENAVAGDIWTPNGRLPLDHMTVVGPHIRRLSSAPRPGAARADGMYDRHVRLFGDMGQQVLAGLKIGIIGASGGGSLISEWLSKLGVGHVVAVDPQRVEITNLPRIVGATRWDALAPLLERLPLSLDRLGTWIARRLAARKVDVARRGAKGANARVRYEAIYGNVLDEDVAHRLTDADFLFLCSDSIRSRLVFNALVQQYLIPGAQIGVKVMTDPNTRTVEEIVAATRLVLPGPGGGCLECHDLIPASRLQEEALTVEEHHAQRYVDGDDVEAPSVITLNVLSAAQAAVDVMMLFTGLYRDGAAMRHQLHFVRDRAPSFVSPKVRPSCPDCGDGVQSRRARGDRARLPCRMPSSSR